MQHRLFKRCALALLALLATACASPPAPPATLQPTDDTAVTGYLSELIGFEMRKHRIPGLSIALVDDQHVVWAQGFGHADVQQQIPATPTTLYRAGSISKLFTGTAVLQLAEQHRIELDRPVQSYLPGFSPTGPATSDGAAAARITPRQLLTHHAGLPRDHLKGMFAEQVAPFDSVVEQLTEDGLAYPPGALFAYSNLGFSLLGTLVQQQSGMPFAQFLRLSVLGPLDMPASAFEAGPSASTYMAKAYDGREPAAELPLRDLPAGGLNTSVADMTSFIRMIFARGRSGDHQVLQAGSVAAMLQPQNGQVPLDLDLRVGLPWMLSVRDIDGLRGAGPVAQHAGATLYHRSQMMLLPDHKLGVIVMANSSTASEALGRIAKASLALLLQARTGLKPPAAARPAWDDTALSPQQVDDLVGDYSTVAGLVRVTAGRPGSSRLDADMAGHTLALRRRADGLFGLQYALLGLVPLSLGPLDDVGLATRRVDGRTLLVGTAAGQDVLVGERLAAPVPLAPAWRARLGDYEQTNADALSAGYRARLVEAHGRLLLEIIGGKPGGEAGRLVLNPVSDTQAEVLLNLAQGGASLQVVQVDGVEHLRYSGYLVRKKAPHSP